MPAASAAAASSAVDAVTWVNGFGSSLLAIIEATVTLRETSLPV
jgi:hypothetical protein